MIIFYLLLLLLFHLDADSIKTGYIDHHPQNLTYFQLSLDSKDNYHLFWSIDYESEFINFEIKANLLTPLHWFAFGFSDYGEINNADLCILWFDQKKKFHFEDSWTDNASFVNIDDQQDCQLKNIKRNGNLIQFVFRRYMITCDVHDKKLEWGTHHLIYATGKGPIKHMYGLKLLKYKHGFVRTNLIRAKDSVPIFPSDASLIEITNDNTAIPPVETTYWCKLIKFPRKLRKKHHIIGYEAIIEAKNQGLVHHMELFHCEVDEQISLPSWNGKCFDSQRPKSLDKCKKVIAAWAMGAGPIYYPNEAGFPFGGSNYSLYALLEIHYNNPELLVFNDNSGIRLYYTAHLRNYDIGILEIGIEYGPKNSIPPNQEEFHLSGHCIPECTRVGLPADGITVFASQLHTHLTGRKIWTQHIRGDFELDKINYDYHYSSHFQTISKLMEKIHVQPGDGLITHCIYNTLDRKNITLGGYGIREEMCINYIHYYPKSNLEVCKSSIDSRTLNNYFNYMRVYEDDNTDTNKSIEYNYKSIKWNKFKSKFLAKLYDTSSLSMQCNMSSGDRFPGNWEGMKIPKIQIPLKNLNDKCIDGAL